MPDYIDAARKAIESQLDNLRDELKRLEQAATSLGSSARRGRGRPRRAKAAARPAKRARKAPRRGGTRADQALGLVKANPGITIAELAKKMSIKQNYLYRVMPALEKDKKVKKRGKGWHAA